MSGTQTGPPTPADRLAAATVGGRRPWMTRGGHCVITASEADAERTGEEYDLLPDEQAVMTGIAATGSAYAAHEAGLTHRDIKPSNIIVRSSGKATVVDFGITKGSDEHDITTTGVLIGTPAYMAPEALSGTFDHRSDLYSLGCVLYEMVTGRSAFHRHVLAPGQPAPQ